MPAYNHSATHNINSYYLLI